MDNNDSQSPEDREYLSTCRKRVVQFVQKWVIAVRNAVFEDPAAVDFIEVREGKFCLCLTEYLMKV